MHGINYKRFAIFLELGATETRKEVRDVILAKKVYSDYDSCAVIMHAYMHNINNRAAILMICFLVCRNLDFLRGYSLILLHDKLFLKAWMI